MCGIVGVIAKFPAGLYQAQIASLKELLWADQLRGTDGTGIIYNQKDEVKILKQPTHAVPFINSKEFQNAMADSLKEGNFIIGHNRAATKGAHTWKNTHPFKEGHISLVHNGTLFTHDNLAKNVDVDSQAIAKHMEQNGAEATLKEIDGAFALVWVDSKEGTLNLARNKDRPLHLIETAGCWIISSELGLGEWIATRNKLTITNSFQLEIETLYSFKLDNLKEYSEKKVEYYQWVYNPADYPKSGGGCWPYDDDFNDTNLNFKTRREKFFEKKKKDKETKSNVIALPDRTNIPTRGFGTTVRFTPDWLHNTLDSAIVLDSKSGTYFMKGIVDKEPNTEIRIYAPYKDLQRYCAAMVLEASIYRAKIRHPRTIYEVNNVKVTLPLDDKDKELCTCNCCSGLEPKKLMKKFKNVWLCSVCYDSFESNPKMAKQMGYC